MSESQVRILGLSGSTRKESFNSKLLGLALSSAERQGADVTHIDLGQTPLPFYDGDLEADRGLPENVQGLKKIFENVDGFIIATPEYNGFFPGILKNCFDWLSRRKDSHDPMLSSFDGKTALLMSATVGGSGGVRSLTSLTTQLHYLGVTVLPRPFSLTHAGKLFSESDSLLSDSLALLDDRVSALMANLKKS
ncbi:MAG: NAD(P)H-dependent oxidoreductase [Betaproteobacteria bacterium]|jgi:NAD(P)H-dependent FMN reductase|nr:NAD(P)H-dependent oxidoreductase [Betaproteobacteria bacterium]MBT5670747.1 NAD(P)H-dependent oxidoreductase [Betaproteobacteria bacterium]MBT6184960.1 NAD(P)H-dependent oxidoreductase [Betaproteobacteria bacterium]